MSGQATRATIEDQLFAYEGEYYYYLGFFDDGSGSCIEASRAVMIPYMGSCVSARLRAVGNPKADGTRSEGAEWEEGSGFKTYKVVAKFSINQSAYDTFLTEAMALSESQNTDGILKLAKEVLMSAGVEVQ